MPRISPDEAARMRALLEASFEGIAISIGGQVIDCNGRFAEMFGRTREEALTLTPFDLTTPEGAETTLRNIRAGVTEPYRLAGIRKDGSRFVCEIRGRTTEYLGHEARITSFRDVSQEIEREEERRRFDAELQKTQKLESLGVLAGGIAHDFNNLLGAILGQASVALSRLEEGHEARKPVGIIQQSAERAAELTSLLLAYAGKASFERKPIELGSLVRDLSPLLAVSTAGRVELAYELTESSLPFLGGAAQLRQVVMNLVINAVEALTDHGGGTIEVSTRKVELDEACGTEETWVVPPPSDGVYAELRVSDRGPGIPAEVREKIFDPFFSTKGDGRGLGLSAVAGIVRGHGGGLGLWTKEEQGATFRVLLPLCDPSVDDAPSSERRGRAPRRRGKVLLVDDDPLVRHTIEELLELEGYQVVTADDGVKAMEKLEAGGGDLEAVLLDLSMPRMGGRETYGEIRKRHPELPVVMLTGYDAQEVKPLIEDDPRGGFLHKPFDVHALVETLEAVLGDR